MCDESMVFNGFRVFRHFSSNYVFFLSSAGGDSWLAGSYTYNIQVIYETILSNQRD